MLCGAKDGTAVITLTGVINVSPTLTPTAADTEEHTPGALETATLLCAEARADAQTAAAAAESALGAEESVGRMAEEVQSARDVVCHLYDTVMDGTAVHADLTDANRYDRAHALSVAGLLGHLEDILSVISPFNIRVVENLPVDPDTTSMYVHDGTIKVYSTIQNSVVIHKWKSTYYSAGGPAELYTLQREIGEGTQLFWSSTTPPEFMGDLTEYATVTGPGENGGYTTSFGGETVLEYDTEVTVIGTQTNNWVAVSRETELAPYLNDTPALWLIKGGAA